MSQAQNLTKWTRHPEAWCLMRYKCEECGHLEVLWNSRDGVTPFSIPCSACNDSMGMTHIDFGSDQRLPLYRPDRGQRYFANMTRERAREHANRNADQLVSIGRIAENERNQVARRLFESYYGDGTQPDILEAS